MSLRSQFAVTSGKLSYWFLNNFRNGGTSLPGKIAYKLDPTVLKSLAKNYQTIIVTGTNGKTMTTALIVKTFEQQFDNVLTNQSGSNMIQGITSSFLSYKSKKSNQKPIAILEVDEANVAEVTRWTNPKAFVLTNIFRDQMDRYGEIYTTYEKILEGIRLAPNATVIANGDASIFNSKPLPNKFVYYGVDSDKQQTPFKAPVNTDGVLCPKCQHILLYHSMTYANLGDYFCPNCDFKKPELTYKVTQINDLTTQSSDFKIEQTPFHLNIGGQYNIYNALAAFATAREFGIGESDIKKAFDLNKRVFGRQEMIHFNDKVANLILVKNPVGLNEIIELIQREQDPFTLVTILNANYADGIDTSWIWDGDYEKFANQNIQQVIVSGHRHQDMAFRLQIANLPLEKTVVVPEIANLIEALEKAPTKKIYILSTYTGVLEFRKYLADKGIIKAGLN
ncbi:MurT ligase domain-containing protein [Holzapfeliella sp. JNUCC 80]